MPRGDGELGRLGSNASERLSTRETYREGVSLLSLCYVNIQYLRYSGLPFDAKKHKDMTIQPLLSSPSVSRGGAGRRLSFESNPLYVSEDAGADAVPAFEILVGRTMVHNDL